MNSLNNEVLNETMNFHKDRYTLRYANAGDNQGIREVYESGSFPGNLSIRFLRNPKPFESFLADAEASRIMVIQDNQENRIIAVGGAVIRREYVGEEMVYNAYLTGLKIHPEYQKKISFIAKSYQFLGRGLAECAHCYTTILDDNAGAIALLEKNHKNMPTYTYLGHYMTFCFLGGKQMMKVESVDVEEECTQELRKTVHSRLAKYSFVPTDDMLPGFGSQKQWYYALDDQGEVLASCYVGNQQGTKQYEVASYGGILKTVSKLPTTWLGYPPFPKEKSIVNHGVISYLYVKDNDQKLCKRFLRTVAKQCGYDLLIWGCFENHPLLPALMKMKTVRYGSRLYEVDWVDRIQGKTKEELLATYGTIDVEVALL